MPVWHWIVLGVLLGVPAAIGIIASVATGGGDDAEGSV